MIEQRRQGFQGQFFPIARVLPPVRALLLRLDSVAQQLQQQHVQGLAVISGFVLVQQPAAPAARRRYGRCGPGRAAEPGGRRSDRDRLQARHYGLGRLCRDLVVRPGVRQDDQRLQRSIGGARFAVQSSGQYVQRQRLAALSQAYGGAQAQSSCSLSKARLRAAAMRGSLASSKRSTTVSRRSS